MVLVLLLLAAFLLSAFIRRTGTELLADARASQQREMRAEAYSALETTLAVLAEFRAVEGALRSPAEGWVEALADTGYTPGGGREVVVTFEDESAKLSLPNADETELQTMLEFAGVERNEAERLAGALHAWVREAPADAAIDLDAPDYTRSDPPYRPAGRPLRSWAELAAVEMDRQVLFDEDGRPTEPMLAFMREVSLHRFQKVNLNAAQAGVLTALGLGEGEIASLEDHRTRPRQPGDTGVFRSMAEAGTVLGASIAPERFGVASDVLRIHVTVVQGSIHYRLSAVIATSGNNANRAPRREAEQGAATSAPVTAPLPERKMLNYPFTVLEIQENAEPLLPAASPEF